MKKKKIVEPLLPGRYGKMDAGELDSEVAKFDKELIADTATELTRAERIRDESARRKRGRPPVGNGAKRVLITIESSLLRRSDAYASKIGLTRSALIARSLERLLGTTVEKSQKTRKSG
jgi:hypothetical protein